LQKILEIAMSATEESLSGTVQFLRDQFASMSKTLKILTAKISKIESNKKLRALTVAPKYFKPSADQVLSTSGGKNVITIVKDQSTDSLTLTTDPYAHSPIQPSSPPLSNALLCPSTNLLDLSSANLYNYNILHAPSSLHDKTIFPQLYRLQYSYPPLNFSTINYHFFFISTLATSMMCTWVTPPLRPPDPTFTKQGLLVFGN
jgi:hypothetical protein